MAQHLMRNLTMKRVANLMSLAIILLANNTQAETLKDPTQQPAALYADDENSGQPLPATPTLQSVMIGAQYRAAIINGQKILLGKKYEGATLIKLNEREAVLLNSDGTKQTLSMNYALDNQVITKKVISTDIPLPVAKKTVAKRKVKSASKPSLPSNFGSNDQSK